jgi:two-component system osmolarity sensor histidine kinase EnvZ
MLRLGFLGRVVLILLALFLGLAAVGVALNTLAREQRDTGAERFPVPAQTAAIVELIDATPVADRARVLKAVTSDTFHVRIAESSEGGLLKGRRMPGVEWLVGQYLETFTDREVLAFRVVLETTRPLLRLLDRLPGGRRAQMAIAVALRDGNYAVFEIRGDASRRVFGIPIGLGIGLFGSLFAAIALWAVAREARPLRELAQSLADFARDSAPREIQPRGAPEIRRLITTTNDMQSRISALIKGRTMLLGAISHDLKTYITRLKLRVETIDSDDQRIRTESDLDEMTALIDEALAVARGTMVSGRRDRMDLAALIVQEITSRQDPAIQLTSRIESEAQIDGDPVAIRRVVGNLLDNARKYGTHCRVSLQLKDGTVAMTVEDDGPGIPEAEREAVFEPFYRLDVSRSRATGGSGLGLAIARQIAEAHGGAIKLGSSAFGGLCAELQLPLAGR